MTPPPVLPAAQQSERTLPSIHRIYKFTNTLYTGVLGATDCWLRFEWQHHGSPHMHGLAWLPDAPDMEKVLALNDNTSKEELLKHVDKIVTTTNPAVLPDGSNADDAPLPKTDQHICNKLKISSRTSLTCQVVRQVFPHHADLGTS